MRLDPDLRRGRSSQPPRLTLRSAENWARSVQTQLQGSFQLEVRLRSRTFANTQFGWREYTTQIGNRIHICHFKLINETFCFRTHQASRRPENIDFCCGPLAVGRPWRGPRTRVRSRPLCEVAVQDAFVCHGPHLVAASLVGFAVFVQVISRVGEPFI